MTSDFFAAPDLPRPEVEASEAVEIARRDFGLDGTARELGSQQDRNFLIETSDRRYVLKLANPAFSAVELEAQTAALQWVASRSDHLAVPRIVADRAGRTISPLQVASGPLLGRMLTFLDGEGVPETYAGPTTVAGLGRIAAEAVNALDGFEHQGLDRILQWDLVHAHQVVDLLVRYVSDPTLAAHIASTIVDVTGRIRPFADDLPIQIIHGDVTDDNVLCGRDKAGRLVPNGIIDFGDLSRSWRVGELAVACAALLRRSPDDPTVVVPAIRAFHHLAPLADAEVHALWPLVVARAAVLVVSDAQQLAIDPANAYAERGLAKDGRGYEAATALPIEVMTAVISDAIGWPARRRPVALSAPLSALSGGMAALSGGAAARLLPTVPAETIVTVDLSPTSPELDEGRWLVPDAEERAADAVRAHQGGTPAFRYGEYRLTRAAVDTGEAPATYALHAALLVGPGVAVHAPLGGRIRRDADEVVLTSEGLDVRLSGLELRLDMLELDDGAGGDTLGAGGNDSTVGDTTVAAGDRIGVTGPGPLTLQICTVPGLRPPRFAPAALAPGWRAVCPDPSGWLGIASAAEVDGAGLLIRRHAHLAPAQEHYYARPPEIERGWKHYLVDVEGRPYVDMINNVTLLGHAHPRLVEADRRQWSLLNTNSRFHYRAVAELAERLAALAPDPLDTVFLVNSGSEAGDLALRLAVAHTGRSDVTCIQEAYHGWTMATDAVSTSTADNPNALSSRPAWVHPLPSPNCYRGGHRGPGAGARYRQEAVTAIAAIAEKVGGLAAIIAEAYYGNAGGMALPDGYLDAVYRAVRAAGGLCIADEVQVGYGRLGEHFWGFQQQRVVPDVITVAKGMGNGYPLGAVITTRDIAASFAREGSFFSSTGASPVSCRVGLTVLDIMAEEELQENARVVGAHLRTGLEELKERHPLIGAIHGMGLYLGVELVSDRKTLEPATQAAQAICERLLTLGVVVQPTADLMNVLKVKPPLCLSVESADFFVAALDRVLGEGW